jgi:Domain of unknown function (DUF5109)/Domain of unknown function (DUF4434)
MPLTITGTFIDEVTHDIPAHNWGRAEWEREFDTFVAAGLDTVILIRAGWGDRLSFPSASISSQVPTLPVYADMPELFMGLADQRDLAFYFGLYDSGYHWHRHDWQTEVALNREFAREAWDRYGGHPSFKGWYLPHETADTSARIIDINTALAEHVRGIADLPVLISPYWHGRADDGEPADQRGRLPALSVAEHVTQWDEIFARFRGLVSHCAFQDGTAYEAELPEFWRAAREAADRHGIELWSNVETFDRDMPIQFPPIEWRKLVNKLQAAEPHVSKAITFEFSHFLSPNSMWPSARTLFDRYQEYRTGQVRRLSPDAAAAAAP